MKVSIVILNWNRPGDTIECFKSVKRLRTTGYDLDVIIVDNDSIDDSVKKIKKAIQHIANCKLLVNDLNLGFAAGNNVGISNALDSGADFVMVLNNDTEVHKDLIIELIKVAKKYPKAGALSPKIYFAKGYEFHKKRYKETDLGKVIWYAGGDIDWNNVYGSNHGVDEVDKGQYDKVRETDFVTGACMFLRSRAIEKVGLFDEKHFMYLEDTDLSQRLKKAGWEVLFAPKAKLWHKVARSSAIGSDLNDYFITRNRLLFGLRYAGFRTKLALVKESIKFLFTGRKWQRIGARDFYLGHFGRGSWPEGKKWN